MTQTIDDIVKIVTDQYRSLEGRLDDIPSEDRIRSLITEHLSGLSDDDPIVRKMRFGGSDPALHGTKYARHGLSVGDVEWLYDLQDSLRGQRRVNGGAYDGPSEELEKTFEAVSSARYFTEDQIREMDKQALDDLFPRVDKRSLRLYEAAYRAMDTAESGYGAQLVGAQYVGDLWEAARQESRLFSLINTFEMTAPLAYLPVEVDSPEMLLFPESTTYNASNFDTVKTGSNRVSVSAKKFGVHQMWSGEMDEDSIIPFVPFLRRQLAISLAFYPDSLVLNGDNTNAGTGNINLDDADPADNKHYLAFDGIRHAYLVDATGQGTDLGGPVTLKALHQLRRKLVDRSIDAIGHDWSHPTDRNELVYVAGPEVADEIAMLDEMLLAKIQAGGNADFLNGQVTSILGHPVISTNAMPLTEADGKVSTTGASNTKGQVALFNRRGMVAGWRRRAKLESERLPATDQTRMVTTLRLGTGRYTPTGNASGIRWAAGLYNISL